MPIRLIPIACVCSAVLLAGSARAADKAPAAPPKQTNSQPATTTPAAPTPVTPDAASAAPSGPAAAATDAAGGAQSGADFAKLFGEFKQQMGQLRSLQSKYHLASQDEKPQIEAEFKQLLEQSKKLVPQVLAAAGVAYSTDGKQKTEAGKFLLGSLADAVHEDRYADAARISRALQAGGCTEKGFANLAGKAYFATNDFSEAKTQLKKALAENTLDDAGKADLSVVDEYAKLWPAEQQVRAKEAEADDLPRVKITTTKGDIVVELFENEAPNTTANFISLVEKHFYDGTPFHRVLPGFMAQGGDPKGNGSGGPGYTIACECYDKNHREHFAGTLSMAHRGRDTGGSQFFLTFVPTPQLNGKHTVFGRVIEGMDILTGLQRIDPDKPNPNVKPDRILRAEVLRKRDHKYEPEKLLGR